MVVVFGPVVVVAVVVFVVVFVVVLVVVVLDSTPPGFPLPGLLTHSPEF